jgi:hypothetical protein
MNAAPDRLGPTPYRTTRLLIWSYFWLLLFEGAIRKWLVPGLAGPLVIVRDPVAVAIYAVAMKEGCFPRGRFAPMVFALAALCGIASAIILPEALAITLYGLRANFLHLPLVLVLPMVLTPRDLRRVGLWTLWVAPFMALLVYDQFMSPADAWINRGAGEGATQIESAYEKIRPAGTFSYSTGLISYLTLLGGFLFYGYLKRGTFPRWLLYAGAPALFLMVALSGSRAVLSAMTVLIGAIVLIAVVLPHARSGSFKVILVLLAVYTVTSSWTAVQQGYDVLNFRLEGGGGVKEGLVDRYVESLLPVHALVAAPWFGYGLGLGTNAAVSMLGYDRVFLLAENEWERVIMESGPFLGVAYILLRMGVVWQMGAAALARLPKGETLALLLFAAFALPMLNGQFAQPAALGFAVFGAGLCLAACRGENDPAAPPSPTAPPPSAPPKWRVRSRSRYSEKLHGS